MRVFECQGISYGQQKEVSYRKVKPCDILDLEANNLNSSSPWYDDMINSKPCSVDTKLWIIEMSHTDPSVQEIVLTDSCYENCQCSLKKDSLDAGRGHFQI